MWPNQGMHREGDSSWNALRTFSVRRVRKDTTFWCWATLMRLPKVDGGTAQCIARYGRQTL